MTARTEDQITKQQERIGLLTNRIRHATVKRVIKALCKESPYLWVRLDDVYLAADIAAKAEKDAFDALDRSFDPPAGVEILEDYTGEIIKRIMLIATDGFDDDALKQNKERLNRKKERLEDLIHFF